MTETLENLKVDSKSIKVIKPIETNDIGIISKNEGHGLAVFNGCKKSVRAGFSKMTGLKETGLEKLVPNPLYDAKGTEPHQIVKEISLRTLLEKQTGIKDLSPSSNFWDEFKVSLDNKDLILNMEVPMECLSYHMIIAQPEVVNSIKEKSKKITAKWYVEDKDYEADLIITEAMYIADAMDVYLDSDIATKRKFARLLGSGEAADDNTSEKLVNAYLLNEIRNNPKKFMEIAKQDKEYLGVKSDILEAMEKGVVRNLGGILTRITSNGDPGYQLGEGIEKATKELMLPKNENLRAGIVLETKARKNK